MSKLVQAVLNNSDYKIAFSNPKSNWDIYIDSNGKALSISKRPSCEDSFFGDTNYIKRLIASKYFNDELAHITEHGRQCLSGMFTKLFTDSRGNRFGVLTMNNH